MFIGQRDEEIVDSFLSKPRIQRIYSACQESSERYYNQPGHPRRGLEIVPYCDAEKGSAEYLLGLFIVRFRHDSEEAECTLAHELLHCRLVLDGATLPILLREDSPASTELVHDMLVRSISHHTFIISELKRYGFGSELHKYALLPDLLLQPATASDDASDETCWERAFVLSLIGKSLFVSSGDAYDMFRLRVRQQGLEELYDLICGKFPDDINPIEHVNALSQEVIRVFEVEKDIRLVDLEEFSTWYEGHRKCGYRHLNWTASSTFEAG